jgi:shikimate 5-dehydrogenase
MKYYSVSQYPGTTGQYYYSYFFKKYNIAATYTPLGCTPDNFETLMNSLLDDEDTAGISISMPYKRNVIEYVTKRNGNHDHSVIQYALANTVITNPKLTTYNCDLQGVIEVTKPLPIDSKISILGNGAMGKIFSDYLNESKYKSVMIYGRDIGNWSERYDEADVIINCTSVGTITRESPLDYIPKRTKTIIDLSVVSGDLETLTSSHCNYISGLNFYYYQFIEQFYQYTSIRLDYDDVAQAGNER